ncbi:PE-PPE domain-containing protein [Mycolicibacterium sp.]|uniref:PE-PPE domain-containing protein n=1 Tax=Mycolicibacterium sp. TaxID=2320850 RepID=UPI001A2E6B73|nr:PE-PPE domain-containing protein [Mycolicibacterium sp.]MBJ7399455.1 PE-PPE domain-containing protein [Mycolicibacterium sp.]
MLGITAGGIAPRTRGAGPGLRRGAAALVCWAAAAAAAIAVSPPPPGLIAVELLAQDALIMAGTNMHVVDQAWMDMAIHNYIQPTLGGDYTEIPVTTPAQFWPFTGTEDMYFDLSVLDGTQVISAAIAAQHNPTVVFGYSQSAVISTAAKRRLAESTTSEADAPDVSFVMLANLNRPNGGINARFSGAYIEKLGWTFTSAAPTDTSFTTIDVARQYDLFADFPRYPLNVIADANAVVALFYGAHDYSQITLNRADPGYDPNTVVQQWGDTTYYFIPAALLPLLRPFRDVGGDPLLIDAVEPAMRVLVEYGYDRTTPFGQPTAAQLIPRNNFEQLSRDLTAAVEQGRTMWEAAHPPATDASTATPSASQAASSATEVAAALVVAEQALRTRNTAATAPVRTAARRNASPSSRTSASAQRIAPESPATDSAH